jgi:hypothetical protein
VYVYRRWSKILFFLENLIDGLVQNEAIFKKNTTFLGVGFGHKNHRPKLYKKNC